MTEQQYQDFYCRYHGWPEVKQRRVGPDYYHERVGWVEFVVDRELEIKDVFRYPHFAARQPDTRYRIIFLHEAPDYETVEGLKALEIKWQYWRMHEDDFKTEQPETIGEFLVRTAKEKL